MGLTIPQIVEKLEDEGTASCEKTVFRDLHSSTVDDYVEELQRKQFADITLSENYNVRLRYRDLMLEKLMPRKVEQKTEGKLDLTVDKGKDIAELLRKYDSLFVEKGVSSQNSSPQSVDTARADAQTG
jgi:hypothetical protein